MFGTFWRKLVRKDDPITSHIAAKLVNTTDLEKRVYEVIAMYPDGCIQDQVLNHLGHLPYSSVTARFKALIQKGYVVTTGETRNGRSGRPQRVMKINGENNA